MDRITGLILAIVAALLGGVRSALGCLRYVAREQVGSFFDAEKSKFFLTDTGAAERELTSFIKDIDGLPGPRTLSDATAMGDGGTKHHPSLEDVTVSLAGLYDDTSTTGPDAVLGPLRTHTAAVAFNYGPKGNTGGFTKYSGTCWVADYQLKGSVGSMVAWTATLNVEGKVARGTY